MFLVGLATVVRLCFMSDIVLLIDWLYCIDLFSCIAASVFNKLTYFTLLYGVTPLFPVGSWRFLICYYSQMLFIYLFSIKSYTNWCRTSNLAWLINGNVHWTEYDTNNELVHKVSGGGETICPPPADGSSTVAYIVSPPFENPVGSTSVPGRVHSPHMVAGGG